MHFKLDFLIMVAKRVVKSKVLEDLKNKLVCFGLISGAPKGILICLHNSELASIDQSEACILAMDQSEACILATDQSEACILQRNQSPGMHYSIITLHKATL